MKYTLRTPEGSTLRKKGFASADGNGSGKASLAEIESFVLTVLQGRYDSDNDNGVGKKLFKLYRPSFIRAFYNAKNIAPSKEESSDDDFVSFKEFRVLCVFLTAYVTMYDAFCLIDGTSGEGKDENDDGRIDIEEFISRRSDLKDYGLIGLDELSSDDHQSSLAAQDAFRAIDDDGGGKILLKEWCTYLRKKEEEKGTSVGLLMAGNVKAKAVTSSKSKLTKRRKSIVAPPKRDVKPAPIVAESYYLGPGSSADLLDFVSVFRPYTERSTVGSNLRRVGFKSCDGNGSGNCSLSDIDCFILARLIAFNKDGGKKGGKANKWRAQELHRLYRPSFIQAFNAAKALDDKKDGNDENESISFTEFRVLNAYICIYAGMMDAFIAVDCGVTNGDKVDNNNSHTKISDRRIETTEWIDNGGYQRVGKRGFVGLDSICGKDIEAARKIFKMMDKDGGGMVLLSEWCNYLKEEEVKAGTSLGKLLDLKLSVSSTPKTVMKKRNVKGSRKSLTSPTVPSSSLKKKKKKKIPAPQDKGAGIAPNVTGAYSAGATASPELIDFICAFQPYAEKTPSGKKLRQTGFSKADPNGNGYASLAECELFLKYVLMNTKQGKDKEKGKLLFQTFRPSYIFAFQGSNGLGASRNKGILDSNDYVQKNEFRVFAAYICIYAGMFDLFSAIDGKGIGIDASDDRRMTCEEFIVGYRKVKDHGFVGLSSLVDEDDAVKVFREIMSTKEGKYISDKKDEGNECDKDDGNSMILFPHLCEYLKIKELEGGTPLGSLLDIMSKKGVPIVIDIPNDSNIIDADKETETVVEKETGRCEEDEVKAATDEKAAKTIAEEDATIASAEEVGKIKTEEEERTAAEEEATKIKTEEKEPAKIKDEEEAKASAEEEAAKMKVEEDENIANEEEAGKNKVEEEEKDTSGEEATIIKVEEKEAEKIKDEDEAKASAEEETVEINAEEDTNISTGKDADKINEASNIKPEEEELDKIKVEEEENDASEEEATIIEAEEKQAENVEDEEEVQGAADEETAKINAEEDANIATEKDADKIKSEEEEKIATEASNIKAEEEELDKINAEEETEAEVEEEAAKIKTEEDTKGAVEEETTKINAEKDAMITDEEESARSKAEEEEEECDKINSENKAQAEAHEEVVNIKAEEEVKIAAEEEDARIETEGGKNTTAEREAPNIEAEEKVKVAVEEEAAQINSEEENIGNNVSSEESKKIVTGEEGNVTTAQEA